MALGICHSPQLYFFRVYRPFRIKEEEIRHFQYPCGHPRLMDSFNVVVVLIIPLEIIGDWVACLHAPRRI